MKTNFNKKASKKQFKSKIMSTSFWVTLYTVGYMILTVLYCLPRLLVQIVKPEVALGMVNWLGTDCTSGIPLQIFGWGLVGITAGYAGLDRANQAVKTSKLEMGTCDMGDPAKLRKVIYLLLAVFIETVVLNFFFGKDFTVEIDELNSVTFSRLNLPLEGVSSALVSTISVYILGNKVVRVTQNVDTTGGEVNASEPWANEVENITIVDTETTENVDTSLGSVIEK